MTAILPQGLISATITVEQHYSFDDSDINPTNSGVLHKLWKGELESKPKMGCFW